MDVDQIHEIPAEIWCLVASYFSYEELYVVSSCSTFFRTTLLLSIKKLENSPKDINDLVLRQCKNVESLNLSGNRNVSKDILQKLRSLKKLKLMAHTSIKSKQLSLVTRLKELVLGMDSIDSHGIGDYGIDALPFLTNLTILRIPYFKRVGNNLSNLINLHTLDISNTSLSDSNISMLTNLTTLNMSSTAYIKGWSLVNMTNLRVLCLRDECGFEPSYLTHLISLDTLYLDDNLDAGYNVYVSKMTQLTTLGIDGSRDGSPYIQETSLEKLTNLTTLNMKRNCNISGHAIRFLTKLTTLSLMDNQRVLYGHIKTNTSITNLRLGRNPIIHSLPGLENIKTLDLRFNVKFISTNLSCMISLTDLSLSSNCIINDEDVLPLINLTKLNVSYGSLITPCILNNGGMPHLKKIVVIRNPFWLEFKPKRFIKIVRSVY
jgi:hypothetical protein